jgi:hypothetical protein
MDQLIDKGLLLKKPIQYRFDQWKSFKEEAFCDVVKVNSYSDRIKIR